MINKITLKGGLTLLFFLVCPMLMGQKLIELKWNSMHLGNSVMVGVGIQKKNVSVTLGPKYHINTLKADYSSNLFYKRGYAKDFKHKLGADLTIRRSWIIPKTTFSPYVFLNSQFSVLGTRNDFLIAAAYDPQGEPVYYFRREIFSPAKELESIIGVGFTNSLAKNLFLNMRCGVGMMKFWDADIRLIMFGGTYDWMFGSQFGLIYTFSKKEQPAEKVP